MRVLVCGGGAVGASIAWFLARRGVEAIVVEGTGVACAASGKSGGFLALDWCDGTPLEALARRSFALHAELPGLVGADWGYRRLTTYSGVAGVRLRGADRPVAWVADEVLIDRVLGEPATTAQVHPGLFTKGMMQAARSLGADLIQGSVTGIARDEGGGAVRGVMVEGELIEGDAVVVAMGPWSILATAWLPLPAVFGVKGHSLVFDTGDAVPAQALFLECADAGGATHSPEVFPRADGTTYVCAVSSDSPLPFDPGAVAPDPGADERLGDMCARIAPALAGAKILARQACFRPVTHDGLPLIGPVAGVGGAYVATGHSVWGILNAPATGEAMAELIVDGAARSVDIGAFAPGRLPAFDPARLRTGRGG